MTRGKWKEQTQRATYCTTPFIRGIQSRQLYRDSRRVVAGRWEGGWGVGGGCWWVQGFFVGDENVLKLDYGDGYMTLYTKNLWTVHFQQENFVRCKFSLSKAVQNHSSLILQKFISHSYHIITEGWERGCACGGLSNVLADRSFAGSYIHIYMSACVYTHTHTFPWLLR